MKDIKPAATMRKPVVRYRGEAYAYRSSAVLEPIDHPGNPHDEHWDRTAITSKVLSWDRETGRIETLNTIYLPEEKAS